MIQLFEHNQAAYDAAELLMQETGRAAIIHPTGSGKSFIGFKLCEAHPDSRVCWLSPSSYIFDTQIENLRSATDGYAPENIFFFTYAKLMLLSKNEVQAIQPDYIILDEFHRCGAEMWGQGVERLLAQFPNVPLLGLSATAIRYLDNQRDMADELFDGNVASEITLGEAIVRGILKPPKYILTAYSYRMDLERYERRVQSAQNPAVRDEAQKYLDALRRTLENADGLEAVFSRHMPSKSGKYIVFCSGIEHMRDMIQLAPEWFSKVDSQPHIYSAYSNDPETSKAFTEFKNDNSDHLKLLYCIDMLNEGVHVDDIAGVILLRPTVSPIIFKQQIGRAMSVNQNTEVVVFDVVMNVLNLCSISMIQEEIESAVYYYRFLGDGRNVVNEQFQIIDELRDCRDLFQLLDNTLTASWDVMYGLAKAYYEQHGDLEITGRYRTEEGYTLGAWLTTQRQIRKGKSQGHGTLTDEQIAKLDAIGMRWESKLDRQWECYYALLKDYHSCYGDLNIPTDYEINGIQLGRWLARLRSYRNAAVRTDYLTPERMAALDEMGMIWDRADHLWDQNYEAAVAYYQEHKNLNVPRRYKTSDGIALGSWLHSMRKTHLAGKPLSDVKIKRLAELEYYLPTAEELESNWQTAYAAAKDYFAVCGNLDIPIFYRTDDGFPLGKWLDKQRKNADSLSIQHRQQLDAINMHWQAVEESDWEQYYHIAHQYYVEHGNLDIRSNESYRHAALGSWIQVQKRAYRKGKLSQRQIELLENIKIDWQMRNARLWEQSFHDAQDYYSSHGNLHIPSRTPLGWWLKAQRQSYKCNKLSDDKISRLEAIGMVWAEPDAWFRGYQAAKSFFELNGHLDIPADFITEQGFKLGNWYRNQREALRNGTLSNERLEKLLAIGFQQEPVKQRRWMQYYQQAKEYYDAHGDLSVPSDYVNESGIPLGQWISVQRASYKKKRLSGQQIHLLEAIKIEWDRDQSRWDDAFCEAVRYKQKYGNVDVPPKYQTEHGFSLGSWISAQRIQYKAGKLSEDRIQKLEALGISWSRYERLWEIGFEEAKRYLQSHDDIPVSCITESGYHLGQWVVKQRKNYVTGKLEKPKADRLKELGIFGDSR